MDFSSKKEFLAEIAEMEEVEIVFPDGYEDALIGHTTTGTKQTVPVYDEVKCIEILMTRDSMTHEEAIEYFDYNTRRACEYLGDQCPVFVNLFEHF